MPDWGGLRRDFNVSDKYIYLDNGAKVPLASPVLSAIEQSLSLCKDQGRDYGLWWELADSTRGQIAELIGAESEEICYASSCTHAINIIAQGIRWKPGDNIVVFEHEFPSNLYPWLGLSEDGVEVRLVSSEDSGEIPFEKYEELCDEHTRLLTVSHVQAGNGYRTDLAELGQFCKSKGILFLVDATQSCGLFPIHVEEMNIDFLCAATYKWMMGLDGLAILYCRKSRFHEVKFSYLGWSGRTNRNDYQFHEKDYPKEARRYELGNLNYTAITALHAALEYQKSIGTKEIMERSVILTEYIKEGLKQIPGIQVLGDFNKEHQGALVTFSCSRFEQVHGKLTEQGILSSLKYNGIRFSPYFYNTHREIDIVLEYLKKLVEVEHG